MIIDWSYSLAGALTGFFVGATGVGGGALMTPILLLVLGVAPTTAIATDLWFAVVTKLVCARVVYSAKGCVDWSVAGYLWLGSLPVALAVVGLTGWGLRHIQVHWLTMIVGAAVMIAAMGMLIVPGLSPQVRTGLDLTFPLSGCQRVLATGFGAILGGCVALTSVGAGALGSVVLLHLFKGRMTPQRLVATDIVHAIPLALVAGLGYLAAGAVDGRLLLSMLSGSIPAVLLGGWFGTKISQKWFRLVLSIVLLAAGAKVFV